MANHRVTLVGRGRFSFSPGYLAQQGGAIEGQPQRSYYMEHESGQLASKGCTGSHNAELVNLPSEAQRYETRAEAYEASQNFGPEWSIWCPDEN